MSGIDHARRTSFGSVARQYDRARPSYPAALVDEVIAYAGARPGSCAVEAGAGTGKATALFAERGLRITAIEPSPEMAEVGAAHLDDARVRFVISTFERAELAPHSARLIFSAQAWHWVEPLTGERIAARVLEPGGAIACFWNRVDWSRCALRRRLDTAYASVRWGDGGLMAPKLAEFDFTAAWRERVSAVPGLGAPESRTYGWTQSYSTAEYIALLGTHSDHILLEESRRIALFGAVAAVIDEAGGSIELTYSTQLCLARAI
ncbi:MAG TPA: class I SAM-dependent methyltransferase [Solirubrobacteraceae bacterium]|nr:class I SAM-dependent methyltransferase [Solirubrobacteraceae bacterium]